MRKLVLSLFALAVTAAPTFAGEYNKKVDIGQKAPDFSGIQAAEPNGETTSLSLGDIKEDVVVVVFLANHCPVVLNCEDRINDFVSDYKGKSVKLVGIATSGQNTSKTDDLAAIKKRAVKDKKFNYVYGYDETQDVGRSYGATNTPQFFVLDKDRNIAYMGAMDDSPNNEGKVTKTYLRDAVDALLAGKPVELKETRAVGCGIQYNKK
ncbi:MAG TPA: thioredoxin family protein [Isosphaeraceae bacterium]|nr:thioredoxin family protein [Isosphaeraceae bacterium]